MNIHRTKSNISRELRAHVNGHRSLVIWFTGLSASGKTAIATAMEERLFDSGVNVCRLDGDDMRHGLCADLSFSPADRTENMRRAGETAKILMEAGMVVLASFVSPSREDRAMVRAMFNHGDFILVHVDAALSTCMARDNKGLYAKAVKGEITDFVGMGATYEVPLAPEVRVDTNVELSNQRIASIVESTLRTLSRLKL